uniref:Macro domain-containing protein n=1 Tax=Romanomermis culicivorax TaxID=13658 RepID=A0A915KP75_ROMCU
MEIQLIRAENLAVTFKSSNPAARKLFSSRFVFSLKRHYCKAEKRYGELQIPNDVVIRGKEPTCYAFVNFCNLNSVKAVLEDDDNIYLGKTKLIVQQSRTDSKSQWRNPMSFTSSRVGYLHSIVSVIFFEKKRSNENREIAIDVKISAPELQIRNVNRLKSSPSDVLQQYLRDERQSGGGEIQYFDYKQMCNRVKVEFADPVASERVWKNKLGHQLEGVQLYVSKLTPISKKYVYLHQIPEYISKYELEEYLSRLVEKNKIVDIKFRYDNIGAVVEFENSHVMDINELEYLMMRSVLCDTPFKDLGIRLMRVREPDSVMIVGQIPSSDALSGALQAFLLSKVTNSIDCSIRYVVEIEQSTPCTDRLYWVIFEDYLCVRFLDDNLEIGHSKASIRKYHDYLGFITDGDEANFIRNYLESEFRLELTGLQIKYFKIGKNMESCKTWSCLDNCRFVLALDSEDYLKIISTTDQTTKKIAETIKSRLKPIVIALDDLASEFLRTKNAVLDKQIKCVFGDDYVYDIKDDNLVIITSEGPRMRDTVDKFLNENISMTESFSRNVLEYRYLEKNQTSIQSFAKGCIVKTSELFQRFCVHGSLSSLKEFRRNVGHFLKDARFLQLDVARSDLSVYLRTTKGQKDIQLVEDLTGAIVLDSKACKIDFDAITPLKNCILSGVSNNLKIFVICGCISEQTVDCIINASDNELRPIEASGVDLMKKAGDVFNRQREAYVRKYGKAKTGDAIVLEPGNLSCKNVIQAVGSWYEGNRQNEEILLRKAITNSMQKANELNLKSVAVPGMCCSSYPSRKAVQIIVDSCTSFFHKSLTEIRFVHIDTRVNLSLMAARVQRV